MSLTVAVNYTLGGTDAKLEYKVAVDVTAGGQTVSATNDAAKLTDGAATKEHVGTAEPDKGISEIVGQIRMNVGFHPALFGETAKADLQVALQGLSRRRKSPRR